MLATHAGHTLELSGRTFKNTDAWVSLQTNENLWGWVSGINVFLEAVQVIVMGSQETRL